MSVTPAPAPPISCRLELLPGTSVSAQLTAAHAFGFDGITLPGRFMERWLAPLRDCLQDSPLPFPALSLGFTGSLLSPHETVRQQCRDSLLKLFDLCAELRIGRLNVPPCLIQDNSERITDAGTFPTLDARLDDLLCQQFPALGDAARKRQVQLLIEPVNQYESHYFNSILHAGRLCRALAHPAIGFTADFFHMQIEELHPAEAIRQSDPTDLRHVHVAENTRVEPGPGSLDFQPGFRALKDLGYAGWIELECRRLSGPASEVLPRSADYIRRIWNEA